MSSVLIRVTASDPVVAEQMADATTAQASQYLTGLLPSFRTEIVQSAEGNAQSTGLSPLLLIAGYRSWNVERLSPLLAQYYGHAVVAGAADRMLLELGADRWLHDTWAAAGAPLTRLSALPADRIAAAMRDLDAAGPAPRELPAGLRAANRVAAVVLGLGLAPEPLAETLRVASFSLVDPEVPRRAVTDIDPRTIMTDAESTRKAYERGEENKRTGNFFKGQGVGVGGASPSPRPKAQPKGEGGPEKDGNLHAMLRVMRPVTASAPAPA